MMSFFFSSRRRHTRYWRDWSSDVCSSDLFVTVGLTSLAFLLTLAEWLSTFEGGFSLCALLTVLAAAAALTVAVLTLLRRLRTRPSAAVGGTSWPTQQQPGQPWQLPGQQPAHGHRSAYGPQPPYAPEQDR